MIGVRGLQSRRGRDHDCYGGAYDALVVNCLTAFKKKSVILRKKLTKLVDDEGSLVYLRFRYLREILRRSAPQDDSFFKILF